MFTTKALFSEVPCPNQPNCLLPRCIFSHPKEDVNTAGVIASNESEVQVSIGQDDGRKRRKLGDHHLASQHLASPKDGGQIDVFDSHESHAASSSPQTSRSAGRTTDNIFVTNRNISPPPLRKKLQTQAPLPAQPSFTQNSTGRTPSNAQPSSGPSTPITKILTKTPVKAPAKQETLNPRALKAQAPASHDMRYRLLKALHEQFNRLNSELANDANDEEEKLVLSEQDLITMALDVEEDATLTPAIYSNVVKNKILIFKRMTVTQWKEERGKEIAKAKAAEAAALSDTPGSKPAETPKPIETGLSPEEELELLARLHTPITGLSNYGYVTTLPSEEDIEQAKEGVEAAKGWEVCDRCKSRFEVFPGRREEDGSLTSGGKCTYHFGKPYWSERSALDPKAKREKKYRCCGQSIGDSPGCTKADSHVFKISEVKRMAAVLNFEKTPDNPSKLTARPVCIDGEMGYTVFGLELIRLTATSWPSGDELFDVLVKPIGQILDLNSRYSGVQPIDIAEAIPWDAPPNIDRTPKETSGPRRKLRIVESPAAARALLFSHLSPQTPIIGHGLENDLNATRIIHPTVVDTALLFPHKAGLPYRNGLKMLMRTHLGRDIQVVIDGKMEGHDSKEDANAAGDLVRFAVGNEWRKMQQEGWTLQDGEFTPPAQQAPHGGLGGPIVGSPAGGLTQVLLSKKRPREEIKIEEGEIAE
jgi:RNA exonuclease 1